MKKQIGKIRPAKRQEADVQRHQVPRARRNPRADMIVMIFAHNRSIIDELEYRYNLSEEIMRELFDAFLAILVTPVDVASRVPDIIFDNIDSCFGKEFEDESTLSF